MKNPIKNIFIVFLILILIGAGIKIFDFMGLSNKDKVKIEVADVKIRLLEDKNTVLVQRHVQDSVSIDSLTGLIEQGKFDIKYERGKRLDIEKENKENLSKFEALSENDQVKEFILATGEDYEVMKYDGYYLINLESINFANRSFINSKFQLGQIESLNLEIMSFNELITEYDKRFDLLTNSYISDMNSILANKDKIINNLNIKISVYNKSLSRIKLTKGITIGVGIVAIGYLIIK